MLQLAASSEFRQAAQRVVAELKDAGVDLTSQVSYVLAPVVIFYTSALSLQDVMKDIMALGRKKEDS